MRNWASVGSRSRRPESSSSTISGVWYGRPTIIEERTLIPWSRSSRKSSSTGRPDCLAYPDRLPSYPIQSPSIPISRISVTEYWLIAFTLAKAKIERGRFPSRTQSRNSIARARFRRKSSSRMAIDMPGSISW